MTKLLTAFDALALIPAWDPVQANIEELHGGLTNRSFLVSYRDEDFVLRLDMPQSSLFRLNRSCEVAVMKNAEAAGLAPHVVFCDLQAGVMLREYLPGRVWRDTDMSVIENLESLAGILRQTHALPRSGVPIGLEDHAVSYEKYLEQRYGLHSFASRCVEIVRSVPATDHVVCGHNDIVAANIIENSGLRLIDWEYACDSDPMFDLASAIAYHNLDSEQANALLSAYRGGYSSESRRQLDDQLRVYDAIQWLWLATRQLVHPDRTHARRLEELQQRIA